MISKKTSERQEIGANCTLVGADGAKQKMDKETNKLRDMIKHNMFIVNACLTNGIVSSGLEVKELVNAVSATKATLAG